MKPLESSIERHLVAECKKRGILCYKFTSPGHRGVPDRLLIHRGFVAFVELKRPGKKPTALQLETHRKIQANRVRVFVVDSKEGAEKAIATVLRCNILPVIYKRIP